MSNIPLLFNSFIKRKPFLDVCFYYYEQYFPNNNVFLAIDDDQYSYENINVLTYDNIPRTSENLYECHSRYYRHYFTLNYLKSQGYNYVMNCMDDGWVSKVDNDKFNQSIDLLKENNADRIDICGPQPGYNLIRINDDISLIDKNNDLPWYLTNQCSIWKIETLFKIYEILGPSADTEVERRGSEISRNLDFKFLTFHTPIINNPGRFGRNVGLSEKGKELLQQYCEKKQLEYNTELEKINQFI